MKNYISKILIVLLFLVGFIGKTKAQNTVSGIHTFFKGTETKIKSTVNSNKVSFSVTGVETDQQKADFIKKSQAYLKTFIMNVFDPNNGQRECKIKFTGTIEMKWLLRFFMASAVIDVDQNNSKKSVSDFFKPYL